MTFYAKHAQPSDPTEAPSAPASSADDEGAPAVPPSHDAPHRRLMVAILDDALVVLRRRDRSTRRRVLRETIEWFEIDDRAWVFSFLNVCDAIDLDATAVRTRVAPVLSEAKRFLFGSELRRSAFPHTKPHPRSTLALVYQSSPGRSEEARP